MSNQEYMFSFVVCRVQCANCGTVNEDSCTCTCTAGWVDGNCERTSPV